MGRGAESVKIIVENDLCVGCGACKYACPRRAIDIRLNPTKGFYEAVVNDPAGCETCQSHWCLDVCPSYDEDFVRLADWREATRRIGPCCAIYTGYSTSVDIRKRASSGGVIREIGRYCLESNLVDGVIALRHSRGVEYEPSLYTFSEDLLENMPGSIYHSINFERAFGILRSITGEVLLIATPCQLTAIRKWYGLFGERLPCRIKIAVGLVCGWMFSRHSLQHFSRAVGIDYADLEDATYRGGDWVGSLVLKTMEKRVSFNRRPRYLRDRHTAVYKVAFSRVYNHKRCLLCVEHLNYLADIAVGDAWLKVLKGKEDLGRSIIIVRNPTSGEILQRLVSLGQVVLEEASEADVIESQGEDLAMGISARQIMTRLRQQSRFTPTYRVPFPEESGSPSVRIWYRNYLKPQVTRWFARIGAGYFWFRMMVLRYHLAFWMSLPLRLLRRALRLLRL